MNTTRQHVDWPQYKGGMIAPGQRVQGGVPGSLTAWGSQSQNMVHLQLTNLERLKPRHCQQERPFLQPPGISKHLYYRSWLWPDQF